MMCASCTLGFVQEPIQLGIIVGSAFISLLFLLALRARLTLPRIFGHLFFLVFPFVYVSLFTGCMHFFSACNQGWKLFFLILGTSGIALVLGILLAPLLYLRQFRKQMIQPLPRSLNSCLRTLVKKAGIRAPELVLVDRATPIAFSLSYLKSYIYLSIGLLELLTKKELEAVLYHEIYHLKNRSTLTKLSFSILKVISPLAHFAPHDTAKEEEEADAFAGKMQKTSRYVMSARRKFLDYHAKQ
jgi:Zn-dependent protease with chaperone function